MELKENRPRGRDGGKEVDSLPLGFYWLECLWHSFYKVRKISIKIGVLL